MRAVVVAGALGLASHCGTVAGSTDPTPAALGEGPTAPVESGVLSRWPEATSHLRIDPAADAGAARVELDVARPPGTSLSAFWSIASTEGAGSGFFYADGSDASASRVAVAPVTRVQDVRDAASLDYSHDSVGPVSVGGIVVVRHLASRRYLAIVLSAIEPVDPRTAGAGPYAYASIRWYLTSEGSASFAGAP
jgi:hypothetical protein